MENEIVRIESREEVSTGKAMEIIGKVKKKCLCCMEEHEVSVIKVKETNMFKGVTVQFDAVYEYCDKAGEMTATEELLSENDIRMKNAYRSAMGLLSADEICAIRRKYEISQADFAIVLGWGEKTVTRYESHQVQDMAHNAIMQKIGQDPEWFMELLEKSRGVFSVRAYDKYYSKAKELYENSQDAYLRKTIQARYVNFSDKAELCGNVQLNLDKVVDAVCYFANSPKMKCLYKVKLMKLLWYTDALSYKRYGHSVTGLVYNALPMGAVPLQYDLIIDLGGIHYEEVEFDEGSGYHFVKNGNDIYRYLSNEDKDVLNAVIDAFGDKTREYIVNAMHNEDAYRLTKPGDAIRFGYCQNLSLS